MCTSRYYWMQLLLHVIVEIDSSFYFLFKQNYTTTSSASRNASAGDELKRRRALYMDGVLETDNSAIAGRKALARGEDQGIMYF